MLFYNCEFLPTFGTQKRFIIFLSQELEQVNDNEVIQNADLKFDEHVSTNTEKANVMIDLIRRSAISCFSRNFSLRLYDPIFNVVR